jgi:hypothetical protein
MEFYIVLSIWHTRSGLCVSIRISVALGGIQEDQFCHESGRLH